MKKILVVEDDSKMRKMLVDAFKDSGFKVEQAENGEEGLKVVRVLEACQESIDNNGKAAKP